MIRLKKWDELPDNMRNGAVKEYYDILSDKKVSIALKRCFDLIMGIIVAVILLPVMLIIALLIKVDSPGPVIFRQERITAYGRKFKIYKFRTMVNNAEKLGTQVTVSGDKRVTRIGKLLRKARIDELVQIFNVIAGNMSFVGTRPEVERYVPEYTDEMLATLLLPAGITSLASIMYKNEDELLTDTEDADITYINKVLPEKMKYNLEYIKKFGMMYDVKLMIMTVFAVLRKDDELIEISDSKRGAKTSV